MTGAAHEAILLAGGRGTRLRPLTISVPKPLLPTAGVPFLAHQLARLRATGVERVVLATSYHASDFQEHFKSGSNYGLELVFATEEEPLGTGGGIRNAAGHLRSKPGDPVVVLNGDVLSDHSLAAQVELHSTAGAAATLHLTEVPDARRFGCVPTDQEGRVTAFHEKSHNPVTTWVNAGCYVFDRDAISWIPAGTEVSVERETFPALLDQGALVMAYSERSYWLDVGTPHAYVRGSCDIVLGELHSPALSGPTGQYLMAGGASIAAGAAVDGGTAIGADSLIGPDAEVRGSVVFDDVLVGEGASVRDSVLARGVRVGAGATLEGMVAGDGATIGPANELRAGARVWPGTELPPRAIRFSSDV